MTVETLDPRELASISDELKKMFNTDQEARTNNVPEVTIKIDQENTQRLKEIIDRIGWPTKSKVGENSAHYAWLLVQHADQDLEFQKKCLELMKQEQKEELEQEDIAYLEDRILVAENKQQLYGTQWYVDETTGEYNPEEIVEPDKLDERRAEMGMEPFAVYEKDMRKMYEEWQKNKNTPTAK
ncbi:MAG: hypothetical protein ACD_18C00174G0005 [uncultured bacterium]|nr:MAG: hypothetical protein ACD_18C00174G0005 [uncultured bacterium]OGH90971.1 MAG: hypothetical protein A2507_01245 [Candidatus Magasanikbacteria bacterium RIFOXYD12_FULL_33_17]HAO52379.1 hypothetical protein [Candidatus Magasanikbacteria bacterium]